MGLLTAIEGDSQVVCNGDGVVNVLGAYCDMFDGLGGCGDDFIAVEHVAAVNLGGAVHVSCSHPFVMGELGTTISDAGYASGDPGNDILCSMLERVSEEAECTLLRVCSTICAQGAYPDMRRVAHYSSSWEGGDPMKLESCHPVFLAHCLGGLLERMVDSWLAWCLRYAAC